MPPTADSTIIAHALGTGRSLARQAKAGMTRPLRELAADAEASVDGALLALRRVEAELDVLKTIRASLPDCETCLGDGHIDVPAKTEGANQHSACRMPCEACDGLGVVVDG